MIENYNEVMAKWANPAVGTCTNMMEMLPDADLRRWSIQQTVSILANADYYYTRVEVDNLLEQITTSAVTREQVQEMIDRSIASKANQSDLEALSAQVQSQAAEILNRYTKEETNSLLSAYLSKLQANDMFANYTKVDGTTLLLNAENIGITI